MIPIGAGDRPRLRPGPQAREPVPADRPVRRHPPRLPRARPLRRRHADPVVLDPARRRPAPGAAPGVDGRQLPRHDPADEPERRTATPMPRSTRTRSSRRRKIGIARDRLLAARGARGARPDRQLRARPETVDARARARRRRAPTSSRSAATRDRPRRRCCRSRSRPTASRSATTGSTASGARPTSRSRARDEVARSTRSRSDRCRAPSSRLHWDLALEPGRPASVDWMVWSQRGADAGFDERADGARPSAAADVAALFPEPPARDRRRGRGRVPRVGARDRGGRHRQRAVQPRRSSGPSRTCACSSTTARARTSGTSRPASRGSRRCSGATRSSPRSRRSRSARSSRSRRSRSSPPTRRPRSTTGATPSRARSSTSCAPARWPAAGEMPHTPYYGSRRLDAAVAHPARRDLRLDRRPRAARPALAERAGRARLDRRLRRPRRRRVRRVRAPLGARAAQPGLEGLQRRDPRPARDARSSRRSRSPRSRATSTTRSAGWRGLARVRGETELADRLEREADALRGPVRGGVLGRGPGLLRDGARRRQAAGRRDRLERRAVPVDRHRRARAGARRSWTGSWRRACSRAGASGRTPRASRATTRSATTPGTVWPHDTSLIAAGLKRYGFDDEANRLVGPRLRGGPALPGVPAAGAVLRLRPRRVADPGAVPGRLLAAGVGGRRRRSCSSRRCSASGPTRTGGELELRRPHLPDWLGKVTLTNLRVGEASVDLLFHRWRGTTSAEVLRKVGDVAVTIRL